MNNLTDEKLTLKKKFIVTSADTDMYGRLKLSGLVNFLIQSAVNSADKLGFGLKFLRDGNFFWVLNRFTINIEKQMKWYDEVEVETWPKTVAGLLYIRDFIVRDKNKNIVAKGTSAWIAIDMKRLRPKVIKGIITDVFYSLKDKNAIEKLPTKLSLVENGDATEIQSSYFDLDINKHVTSSRYFDWCMDRFTTDFHSKNYPQKVSMNYLKETKPNEKLKIFKSKIADNIFHFEGFNIDSKKQAFRCEIEF